MVCCWIFVICIICFALDDNTDDDDVWTIVDRAKEKGFVVEVLPSTQLTPPTRLEWLLPIRCQEILTAALWRHYKEMAIRYINR
jgi:hypothetical protein